MKISLSAIIVHVKDVTKGKEWFEKVFGMETVDFDPENFFVKMKLEDTIFYIEAPNDLLTIPGGDVGVRSSAIFLVDDIHAFFLNAAKNNVRIVREPVKQFYGGTDGIIADPDNNEFIIHEREKE